MKDKKLTLDELMGSSVVEKPENSENGSNVKETYDFYHSLADKMKISLEHVANCAQIVREDTNRIHALNMEICSAYLCEDGTPRDFADHAGREAMTASVLNNTDVLLTAINDFTAFKNELLKSIPEKVEANLSKKHETLLEKFYKQRIYYILSLVFSIAFGTCFTVLFWFRNAQLGDKVKEMEQQKKDYQEFVNWGHFMKERNPKTWKKWENGEIKYTPAPDKQS